MNRHFSVSTSLILTAILILTAGCAYIAPVVDEKNMVVINTIGVLPTEPFNLKTSDAGGLAELTAGAAAIDGLLAEYFMDDERVHFISQNQLLGQAAPESGNILSLARTAGQQLKYDAILVTTVERYQERNGSEYVVITPASVSFSFKLLAVESGRILWSSDFDQTQKPLFENILGTRSTGSGFRWLTALELTSAGLTKKLNSCPYLKRD
jgi:hypothetical protein